MPKSVSLEIYQLHFGPPKSVWMWEYVWILKIFEGNNVSSELFRGDQFQHFDFLCAESSFHQDSQMPNQTKPGLKMKQTKYTASSHIITQSSPVLFWHLNR